MTPINDLYSTDSTTLAKGERLMRCKMGSIYRLLDLYGWSQLSSTSVTVRNPLRFINHTHTYTHMLVPGQDKTGLCQLSLLLCSSSRHTTAIWKSDDAKGANSRQPLGSLWLDLWGGGKCFYG